MGKLATFSLHNRALIALVTVFVAVFGTISAGALKMELIPNLQMPIVGVVAPYPGASPEAVEEQVVKPLEGALTGIDGLESINATAAPSAATVMVNVKYGTDLDRAKQQVENALADVQALPEEVEPIVFAGDFDQFPIVQLAVTSDKSPAELASDLERFVVGDLEDVEGVRQVQVTGGPVDRVELTIKPGALAQGVTMATLKDALEENGRMIPAGTVDSEKGERTLSVQVGTTPRSTAELGAVAVTLPDDSVTTLEKVADIEVAAEPASSYSRTNGNASIAVSITKTPDGNTVDISNDVAELIPELEKHLGQNTEFTVVFDQAPFIEKSIEDLLTEGGLGLLFAVAVILLFLFSLRSTLVTAISIPLSLLVTLIGLRVGGYSLNILTLGALTVAIGRVVDDSIVVIENIKRHLSYGEEKRPAIITAVREVGGAITSSTIATAAVFVPIGLVSGQVGELFRPFAFTVALALMASLLVALTIVPVLAYWFLPATHGDVDVEAVKAAAETHEDRSWLRRAYDPALRFAIRRPWALVALAVAVLVGTVALSPLIKTNFLGDSGQNTLTVSQTLPPGASLAAQDSAAREIEDVLVDHEGVESVQTTVGASGAEAFFLGGGTSFSVTLEEDTDPAALAEELTDELADASGEVKVSATDTGFGSALAVTVTGTELDSMEKAAEQVRTAMEGIEGIGQITSDAAAEQPIITVEPNAAGRAAGMTTAGLGGLVAATLNQFPIDNVSINGKALDVVVAGGPAIETVEQLKALPVGAGATLGQLADVTEENVATGITRIDGERAVTVSADPAAEDLGSLTSEVSKALDELDLPEGTEASLGGVAEDQAEAFAQLGLALLVAIAIVYVVMVATFRSLVQPLILLVSVPFAATGVLALLAATGIPLGVPSLIGALMLVGIVVTNAIVLIDLVNQARERGESIVGALEHGGQKRVRPIVMTALATILALTPMGLGVTGGSAFISQPLAIVVIGGLVSSTALTLLLVPALYLLVERRKERRAGKRQKRREARALRAGAQGA